MSKLKMVMELQELLKDLKQAAANLEQNFSSLKSILAAQEFIPEELSDSTTALLKEIQNRQEVFASQYEALYFRKPDSSYSVLEKELSEFQRVLEKRTTYLNAVQFFLTLHSNDVSTEKMLQNRKDNISAVKPDSMESEDLEDYAKPYLWLQQALMETDERQKFSLIYKLVSCFEEEIVAEIHFGTILIDDTSSMEIKHRSPKHEPEKTENIVTEITTSEEITVQEPLTDMEADAGNLTAANHTNINTDVIQNSDISSDNKNFAETALNANTENAADVNTDTNLSAKNDTVVNTDTDISAEDHVKVSNDVNTPVQDDVNIRTHTNTMDKTEETLPYLNAVQKPEEFSMEISDMELTDSAADLPEISDTEFTELFSEEFLKDILVPEDPSLLHTETSKKATKKFGVKDFKQEMTKELFAEKTGCMLEALYECGYSMESFIEKRNVNADSYKLATEKLYHAGYLKKYIVDGMGEFFTLSPRGERAFSTKDAISFLHQSLKRKYTLPMDQESIEDTTNAAITRLVSYDTVFKQRRLVPDYEFTITGLMDTNYFVNEYPDSKEEHTTWFAGMITEHASELQKFKTALEELLCADDFLIISGISLKQTKALADWAAAWISVDLEGIAYTSYFETEVFDLHTGLPLEPKMTETNTDEDTLETETVQLSDGEDFAESKDITEDNHSEFSADEDFEKNENQELNDDMDFAEDENQELRTEDDIQENIDSEPSSNEEPAEIAATEETLTDEIAVTLEIPADEIQNEFLMENDLQEELPEDEAAVTSEIPADEIENEILAEKNPAQEESSDLEFDNLLSSLKCAAADADALLKETERIKKTAAPDETITASAQTLTEEDTKKHIEKYQKMIISGKTYAASAYLKALTMKYSVFEPHYRQLAYAVNDPMENCTYNSDTIFDVFYTDTEPVSDYWIVAATLRNYFLDQYSYDYSIQDLYTTLLGNELLRRNHLLQQLVYDFMKFKNEQHKGLDRYADYREKERGSFEKRLAEIQKQAREDYEHYSINNFREKASHRRFLETCKLLLGTDSDLCQYLKVVVEDNRSELEMVKKFLAETYIKDQAVISEENIDSAKMEDALNLYWELSSDKLRNAKKTSDLMSGLRMNLYQKVHKIVSVLCSYVSVIQSCLANTDDASLGEYQKIRTPLLDNIQEIKENFSQTSSSRLEEYAGQMILMQTLTELEMRLSGEYKKGSRKFYYIHFLKNDKILLDEDYLPVLDEVPELPQFSVISRIQAHYQEEEQEFPARLQAIFEGDDDYGSAALILRYLQYQEYTLSAEESALYDIEKAIVYPLKDLENKRKEFIEDIELAQSYGQIDSTVENRKETILQIMEGWYTWAIDTQNYGFFTKILTEFRKKIKKDACVLAVDLKKNLLVYLEQNPDCRNEELIRKAVFQIHERIEQQNYAAAEDLLNRVLTQDLNLEMNVEQEDYLKSFLDEHDEHYKKTANPRVTLQALMNFTKLNKDTRGGNKLLEYWPKGAGTPESTLKHLLSALGFQVESVQSEAPIGGIENYSVLLKHPENGRKSNYTHPIYAFGSEAEEKDFRIICLFGKADHSRLIDTFKEVGNAKDTLVLLDYALALPDRRALARKTKTDLTGKIFAVLDRVVITYLAKHYVETSINRMLMSIIMPFASCQPYIDKSANVMPPEIFIGRKYELEKIESPTGVNIVYGGRQLGKSALLRMAGKNIDRNENGDRAVLVDIKGKDYRAAARKISAALYDEGIFTEEHITEDWDELARDIRNRLRSDTDRIPYLLLLLDEADAFLESCESVGYHPFDALKEIQILGTDRFKFVVAGLRDTVRFKRKAALGGNCVLPHLESLTVKPFKSMEARELLEVPLSYLGFRFPKDNDTEVLISTIFGTTNYFPGLLQLYCKKLIEAICRDYAGYSENDTPPYIVRKEHIKKVLAEQSLQEGIREKFFITLEVDDDDYYSILAFLTAYHHHQNKSKNGCSAEDLLELAGDFSISKISALSSEQITALMEEMRELNVLQHTGDGHYRFARHSFCQMMGTVTQIEDELMKHMEDE